MKTYVLVLGLALVFSGCRQSSTTVIDMEDFGISPDSYADYTLKVNTLIDSVMKSVPEGDNVIFKFSPGRYDFYPSDSVTREYYISNHDQVNPKYVGIALEGYNNMTLDGSGADFVFHGRMLPVSVVDNTGCKLQNFSIDFEQPQIAQVSIISNDTIAGRITYRPAPWVRYEIRDSIFTVLGEGWEMQPYVGIAFEEQTKHLVYRTSDIEIGTNKVSELSDNIISAPWRNSKLVPGTVVAMRTYDRPCPGIFFDNDKDIELRNIQVHYAEGMGLLAQLSENITLDNFSVCLRGDDDPRYFTTQADATHFSACKGKIISTGGLYEGMMDDAINVHGTYLKLVKRLDDNSVVARYMHPQSYGFRWGDIGDSVQFVTSNTMEILDGVNTISAIIPYGQDTIAGAKEYRISFTEPLAKEIHPDSASYGLENLQWTPSVYFADNVIRNNRARGSLFSTPRRVLVERNTFDHTSGTAILLSGDCNGWFETGACRDVVIRENKFINALTNMFQFTNAVISIYPEIPDLDSQRKYFHSGIVIENNTFDTFDNPLLYAKSVDGLVFKNNTVKHNNDYPPFHWNDKPILLERVQNADVQ